MPTSLVTTQVMAMHFILLRTGESQIPEQDAVYKG